MLEPQSSTGPGAAGAILDKINQVTNGGVVKVLGPTPVVQGFRQLKQCQLVKGSEIKLWIAALQEALPVMKAMNFDTRDQDKAIACLTKLAKEFNWLGEAILVSPEVVKTPTPTTPTRPTAPSKPVTPERPSTPTVPVTKSPEKAKIGDATVVPRRN